MQWIFFSSHLNGIRQIFDYCAGVLNTQNSCILVCESTVVFYLQLYIHCLSIYCLHLLFYSLKNSYIATKKAWIKSKWRKKNIYRKWNEKISNEKQDNNENQHILLKNWNKIPKNVLLLLSKMAHKKQFTVHDRRRKKKKKKVKKQCSSPKFKQQEFTVFYFDINVIIWKMEYRTNTKIKYFY